MYNVKYTVLIYFYKTIHSIKFYIFAFHFRWKHCWHINYQFKYFCVTFWNKLEKGVPLLLCSVSQTFWLPYAFHHSNSSPPYLCYFWKLSITTCIRIRLFTAQNLKSATLDVVHTQMMINILYIYSEQSRNQCASDAAEFHSLFLREVYDQWCETKVLKGSLLRKG